MKKELLILSLETTTRLGSIAILRGNEILAEKTGDDKSSQSSKLLSDIGELLQKCGLTLKEIELIAVAVGPGSFTGLRIGLSTAKALAKALTIPIVGVSTLEAAADSYQFEGKVCATLPAGKNEFFVQCFKKDNQIVAQPLTQIEICSFSDLTETATKINPDVVFVNEEILNSLIETMGNRIQFHALPKNPAIYIGHIANRAFKTGKLSSYPPDPVYARGVEIGGNKNV